MEPFWGPVDAMHQFCEAKYAVSPYVAEFWNTFSNIPCFVLPGLYTLLRGRCDFDLRVKLMWACMAVVGMGSFMFHGTMRFKWEMLDEVPMVLLILTCLSTKDDTHWIMSGRWKIFIHATALLVGVGGIYLYIAMEEYEMFLHTFTTLILLDMGVCIMVAFGGYAGERRNGLRLFRRLVLVYICSITIGKLLWEIERQACPAGVGGSLAFLHVAWHFFAGLSCYVGCMGDTHNRFIALGVGCAVDTNPFPLMSFFSFKDGEVVGKSE